MVGAAASIGTRVAGAGLGGAAFRAAGLTATGLEAADFAVTFLTADFTAFFGVVFFLLLRLVGGIQTTLVSDEFVDRLQQLLDIDRLE